MMKMLKRLFVMGLLAAGVILAGCENDSNGSDADHLPSASDYGVADSDSSALVILNQTPNGVMRSIHVSSGGLDGGGNVPDIGPGGQYVMELPASWCRVSFRGWVSDGIVSIGAYFDTRSFELHEGKAVLVVFSGNGTTEAPHGVKVED